MNEPRPNFRADRRPSPFLAALAVLGVLPPLPPAMPRRQRCCERDTDGDGNCDRHSAPGVMREKPFDTITLPPEPIVPKKEFRQYVPAPDTRDRHPELNRKVLDVPFWNEVEPPRCMDPLFTAKLLKPWEVRELDRCNAILRRARWDKPGRMEAGIAAKDRILSIIEGSALSPHVERLKTKRERLHRNISRLRNPEPKRWRTVEKVRAYTRDAAELTGQIEAAANN